MGGLVDDWLDLSENKAKGSIKKNVPKSSKCKLKTCPYWTKTCAHWTCFGTNYPKIGVGLALTLDKNFNFSKVLLSPKFNNNSIIIEVKKKNLYCIVYHTLEWNIDPIERKDKYVVEIFFLHCHTH